MADDDKAAREAQEKRILELVKQGITKWVADQEKTRTEQAGKKKPDGLFGSLFS